jgi:hypothetical protein
VAILDACVLIPMPLADTLLRLGSGRRLFRPRWSEQILEEVERNLIRDFAVPPAKAERRIAAMRRFFPESMVHGHERLIGRMRNAVEDRHVLAAAVHCRARYLVTYNGRDFPAEALAPYPLEAIDPDRFLLRLWAKDPFTVMDALRAQSSDIGRPVAYTLERLAVNAPNFAMTAGSAI